MATEPYICGSSRMRSAQSATVNSKQWHLFPSFHASLGTLSPFPIKMTTSSSCWDCGNKVVLPVWEKWFKNLSPPFSPLHTHNVASQYITQWKIFHLLIKIGLNFRQGGSRCSHLMNDVPHSGAISYMAAHHVSHSTVIFSWWMSLCEHAVEHCLHSQVCAHVTSEVYTSNKESQYKNTFHCFMIPRMVVVGSVLWVSMLQHLFLFHPWERKERRL